MSSQHARAYYTHDQVREQVQQPNVVRKKVKVQKRWVTRGEKMMYVIFAVIFLSISAYLVSYSSSLDQLNREVESLNTQIQQQTVHNKNLAFKQKELSQPERIIENAKKHGLEVQNTQVKRATDLVE
ncbi:cell division protein FtsL [Gracilibacillus thailandensis]|jgi:cell division protein FtsL|uniref:Cell division protein FtsL n=1 Tax=Gracilibacillus thailandensis TaxID=563735 RepID=A0A6N7QX77_9BACI|nr:cell division protein FtsL [Gracilibacillus thailandensis]MRI66723.1 cell division protein FtsL [Gracilibacillus thailandensis]